MERLRQPNDPLPAAIFRVIEAAEAEGWLEALVAAACRARPKLTALAQVAAQLGITPLGAGNRMHFDANTLPGSSGSPIFNAFLQLIGLHHSGNTEAHAQAAGAHANQRIPIRGIVALLTKRGKWPLA